MISHKSSNKAKQLSIIEQHSISIKNLEKCFSELELLLKQRTDSIHTLEKKMMEFQEVLNADRYSIVNLTPAR